MVRTMAAFDSAGCWDGVAALARPVLLVLGETGGLAIGGAEQMLAEAVVAEGAGHDVHLDAPDRWPRILTQYLTEAR